MTSQLLNRPGSTANSALSLLNRLQDLPDNEVAHAWREVLCRERDLPPAEQRRRALERAYAWLLLDDVDVVLASSFEQALETFPADEAGAIIERERDAALNGLNYQDYQRLARILRWLDLPATGEEPRRTFPAEVVPLAVNLLSGVRVG